MQKCIAESVGMSTNLAIDEAFKPELRSLEECLDELQKFGKPRVSKLRGWNASIEVFVTGKGVEFQINSDFSHETPKEAVNVCYERLLIAIRKIKETI